MIVWSREGFLISLIQLFPSPRSQGHSILDAPPPRFRFLFYCWRTSWLSDRTSSYHENPSLTVDLKTFPARWLCLLAWYRSDSSNLIFIQRSPSSFPLLSVCLSPKISIFLDSLFDHHDWNLSWWGTMAKFGNVWEVWEAFEYARTISSLFWFFFFFGLAILGKGNWIQWVDDWLVWKIVIDSMKRKVFCWNIV